MLKRFDLHFGSHDIAGRNLLRLLGIVLLHVPLLLTFSAKDCSAQDVPSLTDVQRKAMDSISEISVRSRLFFLASDALEGRGTPSRGFDIACDYVATQFAAAGLEGLGEDGGYFQTATVPAVQTPTDGIVVRRANGGPLDLLGLLCGGEDHLTYSGKLQTVKFDAGFEDQTFAGPVFIDTLPDESQPRFRQLSQIARLANQLKSRGATAMIVQCAADSQLVLSARDASRPALENRQSRISLPVILIETGSSQKIDFSVEEFELVVPPQIRADVAVRNTIGLLRGSDPELANEAIIVTAHLDHLGIGGTGDDRIFNGADDNATGCTAVLMLADAFASLPEPPKRSMIFMTFWGEERGLMGSKYFVENPLWPLDKIVANINIEMVGRPEPGAQRKSWMTGWDQSDLGTLMALGSIRADIEIFQHPRFSAMLYRASDNFSFVQKGVIAHSFSAGSLHSDYHQPSDEVALIETDHMTDVIKGLFAGTLLIADGHVTPKKN
ncbi:MAG TPA: M28 family peptidase [Pirellulaceae bacterium]|nr:M28 family peptidase [Pirellulaceae bacterium]HMO91697.1 M28 family peptidase [Pirellulaceae bacterium]HMP68394.1 M28 family peptidase [Pirellulaceae bacterium]